MADIDERKIKVYDFMHTLFWKSVFSIVVIYAFLKVLDKLLDSSTVFDSVKLGAIELFLVGTVYVAFMHYFPSRTKE